MARKDLVKTTASVVINGVTFPLGEFKRFSGGELTSADIKSSPGAGKTQLARGGRQMIGNITIAKEDDGTVDLKTLAGYRGRARMSITRTPLDDSENALTARAITYTGVLLNVTPGEGDTESETDLDEFELEISCDGKIS